MYPSSRVSASKRRKSEETQEGVFFNTRSRSKENMSASGNCRCTNNPRTSVYTEKVILECKTTSEKRYITKTYNVPQETVPTMPTRRPGIRTLPPQRPETRNSVPKKTETYNETRKPLSDVNERYKRLATAAPKVPQSLINKGAIKKTVARKTAPREKEIKVPTKNELANVTFRESDLKYLEEDDNVSFVPGESFDFQSESDSSWKTCKTYNDEYNKYNPVPYKKVQQWKESNNNVGISPILSAEPVPANYSVINDSIPSLRKKTLRRNVLAVSTECGVVDLDTNTTKIHVSLLYPPVYIHDIILHLCLNENRHVLKPGFIQKYNTSGAYRAMLVNWLLRVQQYFSSDPSVFYMSVRLFDKFIDLVNVPGHVIQLVGLAVYWISCKYGDIIEVPTAPAVTHLCNKVYTVQQLLNMERKVLSFLRFNLAVEEPMVFVRYYMYIMQLEKSDIVSVCSNYLLDCLMLDTEASTFPASLQGAAAVNLAMKLLSISTQLWTILEKFPGYHSPEKLKPVQKKIYFHLHCVSKPEYQFREPYFKYTSAKYASISVKIAENSEGIFMNM